MLWYKKYFLLCFPLWFLAHCTGFCQNTRGGHDVPRVGVNLLSSTLNDLSNASEDTTKTNLLLRLSCIYYWQNKTRYHYAADSALFFAQQALNLSSKIKFTKGITESEFLLCRTLIDKSDMTGARRIVEMSSGEQKVRLLIVIGEHYVIFQPSPIGTDNLRIAYPVLKEALSLSEGLRSNYWLVESLAIMGKYYYVNGDISRGEEFFFRIIKLFEQTHDVAKQAYWWGQMADYMPYAPERYSEELSYYQKALDLYLSINHKTEAASVYGGMAFLDKTMNYFDDAKKLYFKKIALLKELGNNQFYETFMYLAEIYYTEGNLNNALNYALQALKNIELLHADNNLPLIYLPIVYKLLGDIYRALNEIDQGSNYYRLCLDYRNNTAFIKNRGYAALKSYSAVLILQGKAAEALAFTKNYISDNPPVSMYDVEIRENVLGACYDAVGNIGMAEKKYLQMIKYDTFCQANMGKEMFFTENIVGTAAYYEIGKFYVSHNRYREAQPYLEKSLKFKNVPAPFKKDVNYLQFKTDSASGNFASAIRHYQRSVFLKDSISAGERLKELNFLKVQFETAQKEKNIKLLEKEAQLQRKKLEQSAQLRMGSVAVMILLVAFMAILYNRNRLKNKKNMQLERQKGIINDKNLSLSQLVREKEWLLKEVHHRVKNNLQIVTSLLNSQSDLLAEGPVLDALLEGKHRIQAMAMIHQRLYNTDDYNTILMPSYIAELVDYLKESFNPGTRIIFKLSIDPVALNLSAAVPIALILNEAISNSLKHAFPNGREGTITVELQCLGAQAKLLKIADDGIGIPPSIDESYPSSFGLRLIRGLTSDLSGSLKIEKAEGTSIEIVFDVDDETKFSVSNS
ncbi:tetratricopeptide repeat-containing sensor histidine kinase [Mucilaginibacter sp. McL0603]|uniref:tetratricopeptide repeat-containing sensor histidine kinase n=1 Tax=Mucilaginibacter sp. McL0603 TaxID=3415670 RepID=UPI003CE765C6